MSVIQQIGISVKGQIFCQRTYNLSFDKFPRPDYSENMFKYIKTINKHYEDQSEWLFELNSVC